MPKTSVANFSAISCEFNCLIRFLDERAYFVPVCCFVICLNLSSLRLVQTVLRALRTAGAAAPRIALGQRGELVHLAAQLAAHDAAKEHADRRHERAVVLRLHS